MGIQRGERKPVKQFAEAGKDKTQQEQAQAIELAGAGFSFGVGQQELAPGQQPGAD